MHGDFSRVTFDSLKRFSAVLAQQGRVTLDADVNEQSAILLHTLRTLVVDALGRHAWPSADAGFEIRPVTGDGAVGDIEIAAGRCWVDGMLVENPAPTSFYDQPDAHFTRAAHPLPSEQPYFVYLDVWERFITAVEQPELRDVALGADGPDTAGRTKVVWQVRCGPPLDRTAATLVGSADAARAYWSERVEPGLIGIDPGSIVARVEKGYRGAENQLYRVEIHGAGVVGGAGPPPTFKWSRDNGSVVFPIARRDGQLVTVTTLGAGGGRELRVGDCVELVDDASVLNREPAALRRVARIEAGTLQVTLDAPAPEVTGSDPALHPLLRRWDHEPGAGNAIEVKRGSFALESGIEIGFRPGSYRAGDYWTFPARVATSDIEWPRRSGVPLPRRADGEQHSYVPLAYVQGAGPDELIDLRLIIEPAASR